MSYNINNNIREVFALQKILVVVDMQNDFIDGSLGTDEAKKIVPAVVNKINNFAGDIYATKDTHYEDYLTTSEGIKLPVEHCIRDTSGWEINNEVEAALSSYSIKPDNMLTYVLKPTFGSTDLVYLIEEYLEEYEEEDLYIELVGLCTDICVVSNALLLKAHFPSAKICVDSSCCAGVTPETHEAALTTMRMCQIDVI